MMGTPANENPRAFWNADLDEAVAHAVAVVREVRPQVRRHLRRERRLRPPRPHPGPPGRDGAPSRPRPTRLPPRPRRAVGRSRRSTGAACPRSVLQQGIDALAAAGRVLLRGRHRRRRHPVRRAGRATSPPPSTAAHVRAAQGRRHARPPDPDPGGRAVLRPLEQPRPGGPRRSSTTGWSRGSAGPAGTGPERAGRTTCSPAWCRMTPRAAALRRWRAGASPPSSSAGWLAAGGGVLAAAAGGGVLVPRLGRRGRRRQPAARPAWRSGCRARALVAVLPAVDLGGRWSVAAMDRRPEGDLVLTGGGALGAVNLAFLLLGVHRGGVRGRPGARRPARAGGQPGRPAGGSAPSR